MELRFKRFENPHNGIFETQRASTLGGHNQNEVHVAVQDPVSNTDIRTFNEYFERNGFLFEGSTKTRKGKSKSSPVEFETFRLISSRLAPQPISLRIPLPSIRTQSPAIQDTTEERHQRRLQAQQAAVDAIAINDTNRCFTKPVTKTFGATSSDQPIVALVVTGDTTHPTKTKVPIIRAADLSVMSTKKKRKRFKAKPPRLRPAFFRPDSSMGPRATGYAYGYRGSWMVKDPSKVPYSRDKMKRGRLSDSRNISPFTRKIATSNPRDAHGKYSEYINKQMY